MLSYAGKKYICRQDDDGCYWDVQLIPDHNKVVLNHWLGLEVEKGDA